MRKIIKETKPHIVHTHSAVFARIAARTCGVPIKLNTKHCSPEVGEGKIGIAKKAATKLFDVCFTDHTIATAEYAKERLIREGISPNKISVIINGSLPLRELSEEERRAIRTKLGFGKNDLIAGMVARIEHGKGQEIFIEAARLCQEKVQKVKFLIAGDGSQAEEIRNLSRGIDNVKFLGFLPDVSEIMNVLDANVNCSYISETSSLSLSEGMSVGAIPVVSDCGGNTYMVKNGENGLIFPMENEEALAMAIIRLYCDKELYQKCSANAYGRYCTEFTAKAMTNKLMLLYKSEYENYQKKRQRV
jgi:glycosyltransferase involved in cell wall biosynthesis